MHLTALVESAEHVCGRYRLAAFRPFLEQAGHALQLHPLPQRWWARWRLFQRLRGAAVILQRRLLPTWQLALLRRAVRFLLFDFDDAVFLRDSYARKGLHDAGRRQRFAAVVQAADAVIAGNTFLWTEASRWADPERISAISTCVDPAHYPMAEHSRVGQGVELVWIGSASTLQGLQVLEPMLEGLGQRWPGLRLKLICDRFLQLRQLPIIACPWSEAREATDLATADIGISWVPNDPWSRGKCGLKVLQYMAAGLPVVANPVGVQGDLVRHGETGFLAESPEQWAEAINRLAHDPTLRQRMGQAGRRRVEADFSVSAGGARWLALLGQLRQRRQAA